MSTLTARCVLTLVLISGSVAAACVASARTLPPSPVGSTDAQVFPSSQPASAPTDASLPSRLATPSPSASPPPAAAITDDVFAAMIEAIASQQPAYRFMLDPDRLDGDWRLDGTADDGTGAGRLFVDVTPKPGNVETNPCVDPDFVQGGRCVRKLLPGGDWLILRGLVEANGTRTVDAALIHPNRTGILAEASNVTIDGRSAAISRHDPLYTAAELGELIVAIDRAITPLVRN
jgi:hypothetical protein